MQESGREILNLIGKDVEHLRTKKSDYEIDIDFAPICRIYNSFNLSYKVPNLVDRNISPFMYTPEDKHIILFSGGKVSTALALRLRSMNKDIALFYVKDINHPEVTDRVREIAERLRLPLLETPNSTGSGDMYGIDIAHEAMTYAVNNGISPRIYMGCFESASIQNNKRVDWRYCDEFIGTYAKVVKKYIFGADILRLFPNYTTVEDEYTRNKEFLQYFKS